ncbi:HAMP domain-containing histidine kinase [Candidatus Saccharibacteria bacterium]|nr:HAMP domain-containing histidine kinase [Candidatus Saccharibacteria bacterium]
MFRKLRNKFILTSMLTTTAILVVAFVSIFAFTAVGTRRELPPSPKPFNENSEMREAFRNEIQREREDQLVRLAITLVLVGISVEILVFVVSYFVAEHSIKPVKEAYEKQREFIANASHELKTPIAAVQANFEALGATEEPWAGNIDKELTRASNLVSDLLTLARTDGRVVEAPKKDVNIAKIVRERAQLVEARMGEKKLTVDAPEKITAHINAADFTQLVDIFLDNAVKYSAKRVDVKLENGKLTVVNDGKTIAPEELNKIFDRFYQTDKTAEGSGLGLAIAKAIAEQNKWGIRAESDKKLTKFSVSF